MNINSDPMGKGKTEPHQNPVFRQLKELNPILQKYAQGDYSESIHIPAEKNELTDFLVNLKTMTDGFKERGKELNCLYEISESICKRDTLDEIFHDVAALIPPAWQYPEITRGKVIFDGKEYISGSFRETKWKQSAPIIANEERRGAIEVYYLEERPELDEGPFLKEERKLINEMTRILSDAITSRYKEDRLEHINNVLRAIRNVNQLIVKEKDPEKLITSACKLLTESRGYLNAWIALFDEKEELKAVSAKGVGKEFSSVKKLLKEGKKVYCQKKALKEQGSLVIEDVYQTCKNCPLSSKYKERAALVNILSHKGTVFGTITISGPKNMSDDKEKHQLFNELTGDLSYALQSIETEKEREKTGDELRRIHDLYSLILDKSPNPIIGIKPDSSIDYVNPALEKLTGFSSDELVGKKAPYPFWSPAKQNAILGDLKTAMKKSTKGLEEQFQTKSGVPLWVEFTSIPVIHGNELLYYIANCMDITERKKAEEALRENEEFIRTVLDHLPIGIAANSVDPAVEFSYMNDNFPKNYRTTKEALADPDTFWEAVYEDKEFREDIKKKVLDDCASGDPDRMYWEDIPITRKGEDTFFICARNIPIPGNKLMISTVWDITERKKAEEKINHLNLVLRSIHAINQLIIRTKSRDYLIRKSCDILVETRGYFSAWIALADEHGKYLTSAQAGLDNDFTAMIKRMKEGKWTACAKKAFRKNGIAVTKYPPEECPDCPLSAKYGGGGGAFTIRLARNKEIYGILSVSVPVSFLKVKDEHRMFSLKFPLN